MRLIPILMAALAVASLGCELGPFPKEPEVPEPPTPWDRPGTDAGPPEIDAAVGSPCDLACKKLEALGCDEAKPTPAGATCAQVCANIESSGVVTMGPECVARAASCSIARHCSQ